MSGKLVEENRFLFLIPFRWPDTFSLRIEPRSIGGSPPWWDNREVTIEDRKESYR